MKNTPAKQNKIPYGFRDIHNNKWSDSWVDTYNRFTEIINNMGHGEKREFYLDQRHRQYCQYLEIKKEKQTWE